MAERYKSAVLQQLNWAHGNAGNVSSDTCLNAAASLMVQGYLRSKGDYAA